MTHPQNPDPSQVPGAVPPPPYGQAPQPAYTPQSPQYVPHQPGQPDPNMYSAPQFGQPDPTMYAPQGGYYGAPTPTRTNGLAIAALVVGILSLLFSWVPIAGAIGGVVAIVLGIVAMKKVTAEVGGKGLALGGLITGALAFLIGVAVTILMFVAINQANQAVDEFNESMEELEREAGVVTEDESTGTPDEATEDAAEEPTEDASGALGTRENPAQPGVDIITFSEGSQPLWEIGVSAANWDAWAVVQAENQFNTPPAEGNVFVMLPVSATYLGPETGSTWEIGVKYVAADGRSFEQSYNVIPDDLSNVSELYTGGVGTGNLLFEVPADAISGGTWAIEAGFLSDTMFFAAL